ncbi:alpha/beta fold hydrolase [Asaia astilbis]
MKLVFLHGWSFDSGFWQAVRTALGPSDAVFLDQGYTREEPCLTLPQEPYLAIGHSAGALWSLTHMLPHCRGLIAFNGFSRFSQAADFEQGIPTRVLKRMLARLTDAPAETVTQFRQQFEFCPPCPAPLDLSRLQEGLSDLIECDGRSRASLLGPSVIAVQGDSDPLVSDALHQASFPEARHVTLEGGHLLPLTAPERCAAIIASARQSLS